MSLSLLQLLEVQQRFSGVSWWFGLCLHRLKDHLSFYQGPSASQMEEPRAWLLQVVWLDIPGFPSVIQE